MSVWFSESWREAMAWQDGRSHVYERFLNRMVQHQLTETVLPLRAHSITGARMLHLLNYTIDAVYLDNAQVGCLSCCLLGDHGLTGKSQCPKPWSVCSDGSQRTSSCGGASIL